MSYICLINCPNDKDDYSVDCLNSIMKLNPTGIIMSREVPNLDKLKTITNVILLEPYTKNISYDMTKYIQYTLYKCLEYNTKLKQILSETPLIDDLSNEIINMIMIKDVTFIPSYWFMENKNITLESARVFKVDNLFYRCKYSMSFYNTQQRIKDFARYVTYKTNPTVQEPLEFIRNPRFDQESKDRKRIIVERRRLLRANT